MRGKIDYSKLNLSKIGHVIIWTKALGLTLIIAYLFYNSFYAVIFLSPLFLYAVKVQKKKQIILRKKRLQYQFKEGIAMLLSGLEAGYSMENSFKDASRELRIMYQKQTDIEVEFNYICTGIRLNEQLEVLLWDFAKRSDLEDIRNFAEVFTISKHKGGDLISIIKSSIRTIQEKIEVRQDIDTLLAGKKLEQNIMNFVPLGILFYVNLTSPDFLSIMYGNLSGIVIMSCCLVTYAGAYFLGKRLLEVEI